MILVSYTCGMMAAMPSTAKKKTQRWCFVPGCDVGYTKCVEKVSLFRAPACPEQFSKWARAIPRADKPLQENSAVCARHFDARYVTSPRYTVCRHLYFVTRGENALRELLKCDADPRSVFFFYLKHLLVPPAGLSSGISRTL